ncbi:MAG: DegV family protein [Clostridia bacterium]|nr:DegV family protein [Clostridia bacterium]
MKIVSDSASSLFFLEDVAFESVPLKILTDEKEYIDTPALNVEQMVQELAQVKGKTSTSCPNVYDWTSAFEDSEEIFAVTITSNLSGSYSAAMQAAKEYTELHPESKIHVIDSLSAGAEMILIIQKLRALILKGLCFEEIKEQITAYTAHTHLLFTLESLNNLARNGRVSPAVAKVAGVLGIRVVGKASDVGTLEPLHKCRGEKNALACIVKEMKQTGYIGGSVHIIHCLNENAAKMLCSLILAEFPHADVRISPCTALCSYYAEKGGMLIGFEDQRA